MSNQQLDRIMRTLQHLDDDAKACVAGCLMEETCPTTPVVEEFLSQLSQRTRSRLAASLACRCGADERELASV